MSLTRRKFLSTSAQSAAAFALLRDPLSAASVIPYGAAVRVDPLRDDAAYRKAVLQHCNVIVPEGDLKWADVQPNPGEFRFDRADEIATFARQNRMELRGHTLVWYGSNPYWVDDLRDRASAERAMTRHIETVVSRYRGQIKSWDVVNEPMPEQPRDSTELRESVWTRTMGRGYLAYAFRAAAAVDPTAQLVINEYDIEFVGKQFALRRLGLLKVIRELKEQGVPLHAVGLQAHLSGDRTIDRDGLQSFLAEVNGMGLKVLITELDVTDANLPTDPVVRDEMIAAKAEEFLSAVCDVVRPGAIITWGISDRYTWVPIYFKRSDGTINRPLPFDEEMRPKRFMSVIERYRKRASGESSPVRTDRRGGRE